MSKKVIILIIVLVIILVLGIGIYFGAKKVIQIGKEKGWSFLQEQIEKEKKGEGILDKLPIGEEEEEEEEDVYKSAKEVKAITGLAKEINPELWTYEKDGDFIEGLVVSKEPDVGENKSWMYNLQTPEGVKNVWGSAILDSRMKFVKVGDKIKITYKGLGEAKSGRSPPKIFKVEVDEE